MSGCLVIFLLLFVLGIVSSAFEANAFLGFVVFLLMVVLPVVVIVSGIKTEDAKKGKHEAAE